MKYLLLVAIILVGIVIIMKYKRGPVQPGLIYRISWFELQVSPDKLRFAALPQQPILLTAEPLGDKKGFVLLLDKSRNPEGFDIVYEKLDQIVATNGIIALPQHRAEKCFDDLEIQQPSVHFRIRYADGRQWASAYSLDDVPPQVVQVIEACKKLTQELHDRGGDEISGDTALKSLDAAAQVQDSFNTGVILKVHLKANGEILVNGEIISWGGLLTSLDRLARENGGVWYSREMPQSEPDGEFERRIKSVLDEIIKRKLPIKLLEKDPE